MNSQILGKGCREPRCNPKKLLYKKLDLYFLKQSFISFIPRSIEAKNGNQEKASVQGLTMLSLTSIDQLYF